MEVKLSSDRVVLTLNKIEANHLRRLLNSCLTENALDCLDPSSDENDFTNLMLDVMDFWVNQF